MGAAANAGGHGDDWNKDMDMGHMDHGDMKHDDMHHDDKHHDMRHDDWKEMECMMSGMCDSAVTYGATATVFAATLAALM